MFHKFSYNKVSRVIIFLIGMWFNSLSFSIELGVNYSSSDEMEIGDIKFKSGKYSEGISITFVKDKVKPFVTFLFSPSPKDSELAEVELVGKRIRNPVFKAVCYELKSENSRVERDYYWFVLTHPKIFLFIMKTPIIEVQCELKGIFNNLLLEQGKLSTDVNGEKMIVIPISPEVITANLNDASDSPMIKFASQNIEQSKIYGFIFFVSPPIMPKLYYSPSDFGFEHGFSFSMVNPYSPSSTCDFFIPEADKVSSFRRGEFLIWGKFLYQLGEYGQYSKLVIFDMSTLSYNKESIKWQLAFDTPFTGSITFKGRLSNIGSAVINGVVDESLKYIPVRCRIEKGTAKKEEMVLDVPQREDYQLYSDILPELKKNP
ncbi:MAG: hypothetical protein N3G21_05835 [Candidatus Hydrogenedentes bacterium]|nr:hypothetical protein [Candidatus Hydrogenedentota bacterium]